MSSDLNNPEPGGLTFISSEGSGSCTTQTLRCLCGEMSSIYLSFIQARMSSSPYNCRNSRVTLVLYEMLGMERTL